MTICWHVDDLKASRVRPKVVDQIVKYLQQEYESIFESGSGTMPVSRGKVHNKYLEMDLHYSVRGKVKITMFDYVKEILTAFDKAEPKGADTKSSAAPANLFIVNEDCEKVSADKTVQFHNLVAKTL